MSEIEITKIVARPVRIIPFDIGVDCDDETLRIFRQYLNLRYGEIKLSSRAKIILTKEIIAYKINDDVELYIFETGIGVFAIKGEFKKYEEYINYYSIEYCKDRLEAHTNILNLKHRYSSLINKIIKNLRERACSSTHKKSARRTSSKDFEHNGISYVMTLSFFETLESKNQIYEVQKYPDWLISNIGAILEPSVIHMEDAMEFNQIENLDRDELNNIIDNLNAKSYVINYEIRKHISAFMSWASVVVIGELNAVDIDEYIAMEIRLQYNWYYIYCLEKNLPVDLSDLKKNRIDIIKLRSLSYEAELIGDQINYFDDSSLPDRIKIVQERMANTSCIFENLGRYKHKLNFFKETLIFEGQMRQKKYSQTSEILLYCIAFVQIASILYDFLKKYVSKIAQ